jgi:hypothetical protein
MIVVMLVGYCIPSGAGAADHVEVVSWKRSGGEFQSPLYPMHDLFKNDEF